jgi:hypothetical protein
MRILVCGGRDYNDHKKVHDTLLPYLDFGTTIIEGGARGADRLAADFASHYGVYHLRYPADWVRFGKRAGAIRNQQMLDEGKPDLVIAFPGGVGTKDMITKARKAGVEVIEVG